MDKNKLMFERDEKGEVLPKKVFVEALKDDIIMTPLTWGEWKRIRNQVLLTMTDKSKLESNQDQDFETILNHCLDPKFTLEELQKSVKPFVAEAIASAIYSNSGLVADEEKKKNT